MDAVVLVIHLMVAAALVAVVLLQRSEGGALGIGGGGGGGGGFMGGRGTANLLTRVTAGLAALFFLTSITLTILGKREEGTGSILDQVPTESGQPVPGDGEGGGILDRLQPGGVDLPGSSQSDGPRVPQSE